MRTFKEYESPFFKGLVSVPDKVREENSLIILLHGVGANERSLLSVGEYLAPDEIIVSLRAPLTLGASSYGWFHVDFTANGPVHNYPEAKESFDLLEKEIEHISKTYKAPLKRMAIMGFSQGSIMSTGLLLKSKLELGHYLLFSGRTLPEFKSVEEFSKNRKAFLAHGVSDSKLPIQLGRDSKENFEKAKVDFYFREFAGDHEIKVEVLEEAKRWMQNT